MADETEVTSEVTEQTQEVAITATDGTHVGEAEQPKPSRERDEHGRFKPKGVFDDSLNSFLDAREGKQPAAAEGDETETPAADDKSQPKDEAAPTKSEGPSDHLVAVAELAGLDADEIAVARDDDQLSKLIKIHAKRQNATRQEPAPKPEPEREERPEPKPREAFAKVLLSDEEFPADDPHRQQAAHFAERLDMVVDFLGEKFAALEQKLEAAEQFQGNSVERERQSAFDQMADKLNSPVLGKRAEIADRGQPEWIARQAVYAEFHKITAALPDLNPDLAMEMAHRQAFPKLPATQQPKQTSAKEVALTRQAATRLGGDPAKASREAGPPQGDRFNRAVSQFVNGRH